MVKKFQIALNDKERAQYERSKSKHNLTPGYNTYIPHKTHQEESEYKGLKELVEHNKRDEIIILPVVDLLVEGVKKGSIKDRAALESLLLAIEHKSVSKSFLDICNNKYNSAIQVSNGPINNKPKETIKVKLPR